MKKQFLCGILAVVLIVFMLPSSVLAATPMYNYTLNIQTRDVPYADTNANVDAGFVFHDGKIFTSRFDGSIPYAFEKGHTGQYSLATNADDPWMITQVYLAADNAHTSPNWYPGIVQVSMPLNSGGLGGYTWAVDFSGTEIKNNSATRDCSEQTKRRISAWGGFDNWGSTGDLSSESSFSLVRTWDNRITDQYGTYNPWGYNDAPTLTCTSSNSAITGYTFTTGSVSSAASFDLDYQTVYEQMGTAGIEDVTFTFELKFPEQTTNMTGDYTNVHTETITVNRSAIPVILANAPIAAAKALIPTSFTAEEGTTTNLLTYLNGLPGMSATGTTLTLESANANVATDGSISYTDSAVSGNVTVKINKTDGTEVTQIIAVTVKERPNAAIAAAQALIPASFTAVEGTTTNLLDDLNGLPGMSATGTTLTLESANANVAADGTISYTDSAVTGIVTVKINKTFGTEVNKNIAVTITARAQKIYGDYVLIVNPSFTQSQKTGTISFDDTTPFGSSNTIQSLSVSEDINQQTQIDAQQRGVIGYNDTTPFGSSDAMPGLFENKDLYQQTQIDAAADSDINALSYNTQAVPSYEIDNTTKILNNTTFTLRGIGAHCYIWMDDITYNRYTSTTLVTAIDSIKNVYDNYSYPVLQTLGADNLMNYKDVSGKLSIILENPMGASAGYFDANEFFNKGITAIHIPLSDAETSFGGYGALLAHEGQHALNISTADLTSWIDEGLSIAAMDMFYSGTDGLDWLKDCMQDIDAKSGVGLAHPGYTGNNRVDYSVPFLFLRYLNTQANQGFDPNSFNLASYGDFYSKLYTVDTSSTALTGISRDAYVIEQALKQYVSFKNEDDSYWTFQQALENFRIAAFKQEDSGIYGFYGDPIVKAKIGGPAMYFNPSGKSIRIEATGGIIVKSNNGSFTIPADAGANLKFIPFNVGSLPASKANKMFVGGITNTPIYNDRKITFDDLRIAITDSNGNYSTTYKGLAALYDAGYTLLAIRDLGAANQSTYVLGELPNSTPGSIRNGDGLFIVKGTQVINSRYDWDNFLSVFIGTATVKSTYVDPQDFYTALDANNSLLEFENSPVYPWLGKILPSEKYVCSDTEVLSESGFIAKIAIPKGATAQFKFDWKLSGIGSTLSFYINKEWQKTIDNNAYGNAEDWATKTYNLNGGTAGTDYTFTWWYDCNYLGTSAYVRNIIITDTSQLLQSITAPTAITGVANGTDKTATALGLPSTVTVSTSGGDVNAPVTWDVTASNYNVATKAEQTFPVNGTVTLPIGVVNTNNVALTATIQVTVSAERLLQSITAPTAITGVINGTAKTATALGLPTTVTMVASGANVSASVTWNVNSSNPIYNVATKAQQTFTVPGTVTLPAGVLNTNSVALTTTIQVTVSAAVLQSITAPTAITGIANGTDITSIVLPSTVTMVTTGGNVSAGVTWTRASAYPIYDKNIKTEQIFSIPGTVTMPAGVSNPNNVPLATTIQVTVSAAKVLQSITAPTAITGVPNGSTRSATGLGLPNFVTMVTDGGIVSAIAMWDPASSSYNPALKTEQIFNVSGMAALPSGVVNTNSVSRAITIQVTVSAEKKLQSITAPTAITGVANGSANTATGLGLPAAVTMVTSGGDVNAPVNWVLPSSSYNVATKAVQTFTVNGTVILPAGVLNTNSVALTSTIQVTVSAEKVLQSITAPTAISGVANGTAKTATALGLPSTLSIVTSGGNVNAAVTWDVTTSSYNVGTKTEQTFTVPGTVTLPAGVVNTNNVSRTITIGVTVNAAATIDECFIATAAFGSKFTWPVALLRHFRDQYLMTNTMGTAFVNFYYLNSPPIANYIAGNEGLKGLTRVLLAPFIAVVYLIYNPALALVLVLICLVGVIARRRMATVKQSV